MGSESTNQIAKVLFWSSVICYLLSLCLPAIYYTVPNNEFREINAGSTLQMNFYWGYTVLVSGWGEVLVGSFSWLSNLLYFVFMAMFCKGMLLSHSVFSWRRLCWGLGVSLAALVLALQFSFVYKDTHIISFADTIGPDSDHVQKIHSLGSGYVCWCTAFFMANFNCIYLMCRKRYWEK